MKLKIKPIGHYQGQQVDEIIVQNAHTEIVFSNFGARVLRWLDPKGRNIVLGFDSLEDYITNRGYYYGATVGPVAGRISGAQFQLNGSTVQLDANEAPNHLHGGEAGYDFKVWDYECLEQEEAISIVFSLDVSESESVYPGNLQLKVKHTYNTNNQWTIEYWAVSDKDTVLNLTNHVYFNLNGRIHDTVKNHILTGNISHYLPVKADGTPTGEIRPVEGTPFDLTQSQEIGTTLTSNDDQIQLKSGYDHSFIFSDEADHQVELTNGSTSIILTTDQPAVVIYVHSFAEPAVVVNGEGLVPYAGVAMEAQALPDAPNHEGFGSIALTKGDEYRAVTRYQLREA